MNTKEAIEEINKSAIFIEKNNLICDIIKSVEIKRKADKYERT